MEIPASEQFLMARARKGDPDAIRDLAGQYGRRLYGFCLCACGGREEPARRFLIASFGQAIRETHSVSLPFFLRALAWLCLHISKDPPEALPPPSEQDPKTRVLMKALARIPWEERRLILLRDQMHLSHAEMAKVLSIPEPAARGRLPEARTRFLAGMAGALEDAKRDGP